MVESPFDRARPHDTRERLFGGVGRVRVWNLLPDPAVPFAAVLACELEAGGSVGTHVQEHFPEIVVAVEGRAAARVNGVSRPLAPGGVVQLPLGQTLALENASNDACFRYLIIKAGAALGGR